MNECIEIQAKQSLVNDIVLSECLDKCFIKFIYSRNKTFEKLILVENIVKPLKEELNETRRYLDASKLEMARQRKAIDSANS